MRVFVIGVGMTKFIKPGKDDNPDYPIMAAQATRRALHDSSLTFKDVKMAAVGYVYGDSTCGQRAVYEVGMTGIPIYNVNNNCSTGSSALHLAHQFITGGLYDCALALLLSQYANFLISIFIIQNLLEHNLFLNYSQVQLSRIEYILQKNQNILKIDFLNKKFIFDKQFFNQNFWLEVYDPKIQEHSTNRIDRERDDNLNGLQEKIFGESDQQHLETLGSEQKKNQSKFQNFEKKNKPKLPRIGLDEQIINIVSWNQHNAKAFEHRQKFLKLQSTFPQSLRSQQSEEGKNSWDYIIDGQQKKEMTNSQLQQL